MSALPAPQFTVVVPVRDRTVTLARTLRSVQEQTNGSFECLVIDDGSRDAMAVAAVVEDLEDDRFRVIRSQAEGGNPARNKGIYSAKAPWVAFLDSDDKFLPNKLERIAAAIADNPGADVVYHYARVLRDDGVEAVRPSRPIGEDESVATYSFVHREFAQTSTLVVRQSSANLTRFDPNLRKAQDIDFLMRLQEACHVFVFVDEVLSIWDDRPADDRVSKVSRYDHLRKWADGNHLFTRRERLAFDATYLAYEGTPYGRLPLVGAFVRAALAGAVPPVTLARCAARTFLPPGTYRRAVNRWLRSTAKPATTNHL